MGGPAAVSDGGNTVVFPPLSPSPLKKRQFVGEAYSVGLLARPHDPRSGREVLEGALLLLEERPHPAEAEREAREHEDDGADEGGLPADAPPADLAALDDREAEQGFARRASAPRPAAHDVKRVRERGEQDREGCDAAKRPVGGRVARLELRAEIVDEEDGCEEEKIDGREDDGVDERREKARERIRGVPRPLVERRSASLPESCRALERGGARRRLGRAHLDREVRQLSRGDRRNKGGREVGNGAGRRCDGRDVVGRPKSRGEGLLESRARPRRGPFLVDVLEQLRGRHPVRPERRRRRGRGARVRRAGNRVEGDAGRRPRRRVRRLGRKRVGREERRAIRRHARRDDAKVYDRRAELDTVAGLEPRLARDPLSSHVRAVRGVEVLDDGLALIQREERVRARNRLVLEADGRRPATAERRFAVQKVDLAALRREHIPEDIVRHRDGNCTRPRSASAVGVPPRAARAPGGPENTTRPPVGPPPGPSSTRVSARARKPVWCSTATIEWPAARSRRKTTSSTSTSEGASPVVGSSKMKSTGSSGPPPRRNEAIFSRCASPPESVPVD